MASTSTISASAAVRGNISGEGTLEILGRVEGDVSISGDLFLGPEGTIAGSITGARVVIAGAVEGSITAAQAVVVEGGGRVVGDVVAPRIAIVEGAIVRGMVRTEGAHSRATPRSKAVASSTVERPVVAARRAPPALVQKAVTKTVAKKGPPPPVVKAPKVGARAKKKVGRK